MKKQELLKLIEKIEKEGIETVKKEILNDIPKSAILIENELKNLLDAVSYNLLVDFLTNNEMVITTYNNKLIGFKKYKNNSELKLYYRKIDTIDKSIDQS